MKDNEMKLFIDDLRDAPDDSWVLARNSDEALAILAETTPKVISYDHDLGGDDTSRRIILWQCENEKFPMFAVVHSANPVGIEWMNGMIERYFTGTLLIDNWVDPLIR